MKLMCYSAIDKTRLLCYSIKCQISAGTSYWPAVNGKIYEDLQLVHPLTRPILRIPRGATFPREQEEAGVASMDYKVGIT